MEYDIIIIGGGPTGLTLSHLLREKKCLLVEERSELGGCHRIEFHGENNITEHGPRIYTKSMVNLQRFLRDLDINWDDIFVPYKFTVTDMVSKMSKTLMIKIALQLLKYWIGLEFKGTVSEFSKDFPDYDKQYLDRICRLIDGGDAHRFPMTNFLKTIDQNMMTTTYQPSFSGSVVKSIISKLKVDILLNSQIQNIDVDSIAINEKKYFFKKIIFAIPPKSMMSLSLKNLLPKTIQLKDMWPMLDDNWCKNNSYNDYITINYFSKVKQKQKSYGVGMGSLGVTIIIVSDYWRDVYGTIITASVSKSKNIVSKTFEDLSKEIWTQVLDIQNDLKYDSYKFCGGVYYLDGWRSTDTAYFNSDHKFISSVSPINENFLWVGSHNGTYTYADTSIDTAISSAYAYVGAPPLSTNTMGMYVKIFLILAFVILVYKKLKNQNQNQKNL